MFNKYKKRYEFLVNRLLAWQELLLQDEKIAKSCEEEDGIPKWKARNYIHGQLDLTQTLLRTVNDINETFK